MNGARCLFAVRTALSVPQPCGIARVIVFTMLLCDQPHAAVRTRTFLVQATVVASCSTASSDPAPHVRADIRKRVSVHCAPDIAYAVVVGSLTSLDLTEKGPSERDHGHAKRLNATGETSDKSTEATASRHDAMAVAIIF